MGETGVVVVKLTGINNITEVESICDRLARKIVLNKIEDYYELNESTLDTLESMLEEMRAIDLKGSFESDDEVGTVFTELKNIIERYKNEL